MMAKKKTGSSKAVSVDSFFDDAKYRAEDDVRTLKRAAEVVGDKSRLAAAKAQAKKERESLDRVARLDGKKL
jgi:hypothetical protein